MSTRRYASTATATVETPASPLDVIPPVTQASSPQRAYQIRAGIVLARAPLITRELSSFEKAFFFYQRRLNERLAMPFTRYFYFKKDTPADLEWKRKAKDRQTAARDIGVYNAYSKEGWNDELLVGASESETSHQLEALLKDAEVPGVGSAELSEAKKEKVERPMPRVTDADETGDERSLERRLDRTLYLLVREAQGRWRFPASELVGKESLHQVCRTAVSKTMHDSSLIRAQAAERIIVQTGGVNMNTWVVGHVPIGFFRFKLGKPRLIEDSGVEEVGEKTFFMKGRIMAGGPNLAENKLGLSDYKWLSKDEIAKQVTPGYWSAIKNMLAEL